MKKNSTLFLACLFACSALFASNDTVRILGIGNSFTMDAMEDHLQPIMSSMNQPSTMAYPYRGGTTLQQHDSWKNRMDTMPYNYYEWYQEQFFVGGDRSANLTLSVEKRPWDYVVIQTDHAQAGKFASYDPYLTRLIDFIKTHCSNKNVKIGLYMTWAYDSISTYSGFSRYKYDTQIMYDSIISAVTKVMQNHKDIDFLIPVGTAIQNARTSYKGHTMNRDGYHLNYDHGRYIASLCWASVICGFNPDSVPFYPSNISEYCANMCKAAVKGAIALPYDTTSLRKDFGKSESGSDAADESRLGRVTFNGLSVPIVEGQYEYMVKINTALTGKVTMYSFPLSTKAEQNITDEAGADIKRDPKNYGYFPLDAPQLGKTVTYTNRVIAEDLKHTTTYTFHLVGATEQDLVYTISSLSDLKDFAQTVNGGQYSLKAELTRDINLDIQKQDCWKTPIGTIEHPYTGTFDGKGYALENFNIYSNGDSAMWQMSSLGLFGAIRGATIKNLTLTSREHDECYFLKPSNGVTNLKACGVLVGWMANSVISRCNLDVNVYSTMKCPTGAMVGLEVGTYGRSIIDRCEVKGIWRARQTNYYAAYVGQANNVAISNSSSHVQMPLQTNHSAHIAGFVGLAQSSESGRMITLQNCYFAGSILDKRVESGIEAELVDAYLGAFVSYAKYANTFMDNCYYLDGSCLKVVAAYNNHPIELTASRFAASSLTDSTLVKKLGGAFVQGEDYPVIGEQEASMVERFTKYEDNSWKGSADPVAVKNGDLCDWEVFHARRRITDRDYLASGEHATWFANTGDGYIKTNTAWEGGVKTISFRYNKYEVNVADLQFTIKVGTEKDVVNAMQVPGTTRSNFDYEYTHRFGVKENAVITLAGTGNKVIHVGHIAITPYLRYITPMDSVKLPTSSYDCTSSQLLINNTMGEGEVVYEIVSDETGMALMENGILDLTHVTYNGDIVVRASWNNGLVSTFFTLRVMGGLIPTSANAPKGHAGHGAGKIMKNNHLYIVRDQKYYDILGTQK